MNPSSGQSQDILVRWFEDEIFYSLCSRQHHFLAHLNTSATLSWLFGEKHCAITHDFPCNLDALNSQAKAIWGGPTSIISEHTILPVFFPFQSEQQISAVVETMKSAQIGSIKYRLGLLTGRFGAEHPLKACTACMATDRTTYGVAYWHLSHQYPGVVLCPIHGFMLRESTLNRQWSGSFQWALPNEVFLAEPTALVPSSAAEKALHQLGTGILDLVTYGIPGRFNPNTVRSVYKEALIKLGLSGPKRVRAAISFAEFSSQIQPYPPFNSLPITAQRAEAFIDQLTRNPRGHCHPLKHLTFITWLFGRLNAFIEAYDRLDRAPDQTFQIKHASSTKPVMVNEPKAATISEKSVIRKPKKLKSRLRAAILECLQNGDSKDMICSQFGVSICTVNRLLRSEPAVLKARAGQHREALLLQHRTKWLAVVAANSGASTKCIRSVIPNIYAWLYRNDREWLSAQTCCLPSGRIGNYSNVDWQERDCKLANLVRNHLTRIPHLDGELKIERAELFTQIPALSCSLEKRSHYLQTRKLLSEITQANK
ncbi:MULTISPECIES: TnsD family transposase [unclassified Pseudomonas]|uniref:TnsD family transposase n=1 Tax=unclassified Pseudomonas TaxID=196821 RepID=UPI001CC126B1|nr:MULTISPECIES: TnsD family transposase [unclassified Pseudomonas]